MIANTREESNISLFFTFVRFGVSVLFHRNLGQSFGDTESLTQLAREEMIDGRCHSLGLCTRQGHDEVS